MGLAAVCSRAAMAQFADMVAFTSPGNTIYYLDADTGDDENPGTRANSAWKTLNRVNATAFAPGDALYIKAGTAYEGRLFPKGSGIPGNPVTIDFYGEGAKPAIHAGGEVDAAVQLENTQGWHIKNLRLTNAGDKPQPFRFGVSILIENTGPAGDFLLSGLEVENVNGEPSPGFGAGAGILLRNRGDFTPSYFDGVLIEQCLIKNTARYGIKIESGYDGPARPDSRDVVIRENTIEQTGGDGVILTGCDRVLIEYNTIRHAGADSESSAGGVTLRRSTKVLVQYNRVSHTQGRIHAAFLAGRGSAEHTFQYNFTHDNQGPVFLAVSEPDADIHPVDTRNIGSTLRYNVSQDDRVGFVISGPVGGAVIYNNTVYTGEGAVATLLQIKREPSDEIGLTLAGNLFYTLGRSSLDLGDPPAEVTWLRNVYFGDYQVPQQELAPLTEDPLFANPGGATTLQQARGAYQIPPDSPLRAMGERMADHARVDFASQPIPPAGPVDIGAIQSPSDNLGKTQAPLAETLQSAP